jgi:hypothetical protein
MLGKLQAVATAVLCIFAPFETIWGNLVVNGDFETGDFSGWTSDAQNDNGIWLIYSGGILPISNFVTPPPPGGAYAAAADQSEASSMILYQDIALPADACWQLQYTYYYNNHNNIFVTPDTLSIDEPNQQARIDILRPDIADPYSVARGDVLRNLLKTVAGDPTSVKPTTVTFDLSCFAGQTIRLRFAVVDTEYYFSMGVDNISIQEAEMDFGIISSREQVEPDAR